MSEGEVRSVRVREVAESIQYGHTASAIERKEGPRFLRITDIQNGGVDWNSVPSCDIGAEEVPKYKLSAGDLVFARTGATTGKSFLIRDCPDAVFASYLIRVRASKEVDPRYLALFFQSPDYWQQIERGKRGIGQPNVNGKVLGEIELPLPSLPAQRAAVAEIEKQFTRLEAGLTALRRVQANLKRYRRAVLKAACEGRLIPTEAEWKQIPIKELIGKISQGWSPKCDLTRDPLPDEWAIVTTTAVQSMRYVDNQGKPLASQFVPRPHIEIKVGDFLMTRKGPRKRAGVACLVRSTRSRLMVCDTVYRFRCDESRVVPGYLELALNSPSVVEAIDRQKAGINESGVSLTHDKLGGVPIPLPTVAEQTRIVAELERRLSVVEELATMVSANLVRAARLRQSVLQKVFSGAL
jgi:type I restriction enzyme S subunit